MSWNQRSSLRDGYRHRDEDRPDDAADRHRILYCLQDRQCAARRGDACDLALYRRPDDRPDADRGGALLLDRFPLKALRPHENKPLEEGFMNIKRRTLMLGAAANGIATTFSIRTRPAHEAEFNYKFAKNQPLKHPMNVGDKDAAEKRPETSAGRERRGVGQGKSRSVRVNIG